MPEQLNPETLSDDAQHFQDKLNSKVIGQARAVRQFVRCYQTFKAHMGRPNRTVANLLFLGPTGVGKTYIISAAASALFDNPNAFLRVNCAEYQQSHEISKLIGSPAGYVGHKETKPILIQERISRWEEEGIRGLAGPSPLNIVAFDEIEKAHPALWDFLLGVMDTNGGATATLGTGETVSFLHTILILTSNLGSGAITKLLTGRELGFVSSDTQNGIEKSTEQRIYDLAKAEAKRTFRSEFFNRLDRTIVFQPLSRVHLESILDIDLRNVQRRLWGAGVRTHLDFSASAKEFLLDEGTSLEFGARELNRIVDRHVAEPLASLVSNGQAIKGERMLITCSTEGKRRLVFYASDPPKWSERHPENN